MDNAIAVGQDSSYNCLVATFNGAAWSIVTSFPTVNGKLWGVYAYSPEDIWVCGGTGNDGMTAPVLYHYTSSVWVDHSSDITDAVYLADIKGSGPDNVWTIGKATGAIVTGAWQYNGTAWTAEKVNTVALSASDLKYHYYMVLDVSSNDDVYIPYLVNNVTAGDGYGKVIYSNKNTSTFDVFADLSSSGSSGRYVKVFADDQILFSNQGTNSYDRKPVRRYNGSSWPYYGRQGHECRAFDAFDYDTFVAQHYASSTINIYNTTYTTGLNIGEAPLASSVGQFKMLGADDIWYYGTTISSGGQWYSTPVLTHWEGDTTWSAATDYNVNGLTAKAWYDVSGYTIAQVGRSTTVDLTEPVGTHRNVFVKIHGLEPILWQYSSKGAPSDWSRTIKTCLEVTSEIGMGLSLADSKLEASGISFELEDLVDDDGTYYFGKLFAPARWSTGNHTRITKEVKPDDDVIYILDSSALDSSGTAYIGDETISYTGAQSYSHAASPVEYHRIIGVERDIYPCVDGGSLGKYIEVPSESYEGYSPAISNVPFTFIGRKIALYIITWNNQYQQWNAEDDANLVWIGRISDEIRYDGKKAKWILSCEHLIKDFDKKIADRTIKTKLAKIINLNCPEINRSFQAWVREGDTTEWAGCYEIIIPAGGYTLQGLIKYINDRSQHTWIDFKSPASTQYNNNCCYMMLIEDSESSGLTMYCYSRYGKTAIKVKSIVYSVSLVLTALGFDTSADTICEVQDEKTYSVGYEGYASINAKKLCNYFHPIQSKFNGSKLYVEDPSDFADDYGDKTGVETSVVRIKDCKSFDGDKKIAYYRHAPATYTSNGYDPNSYAYALQITENMTSRHFSDYDYIGATEESDAPDVEQVFLPNCVGDLSGASNYSIKRGPFELLLRIILSTGTPGYNDDTYDCYYPKQFCFGMSSQLIDIDSFIAADAIAKTKGLNDRRFYVVENKSVMELLQTECKLYGMALVWSDAKFRIIEILPPSTDTYQATIDDDVVIDRLWQPVITYSTSTVANQYECNVNYNWLTGKFDPPIKITDMDSQALLEQTRTVSIEHKGIYTLPSTPVSPSLLAELLLNRFIRYPMPVFSVPIAPTLVGLLYTGDVVRVTLPNIHDPFGSGERTTDSYGIVLSLNWDYNSWLGNANIMLFGLCEFGSPYSGAAAVDITATNGGWDSLTCRLTLLPHEFGDGDTDSEDGSRFSAGDFVKIVERAPADPLNPQYWGPIEVDKDYGDDGDYILTLVAGTTLTGWDSTREYTVTYADYGDVVVTQASSSYIGDYNEMIIHSRFG